MERYFILQMMTSKRNKLAKSSNTLYSNTNDILKNTHVDNKATTNASKQSVKDNYVSKNNFQIIDDETLMILLSL